MKILLFLLLISPPVFSQSFGMNKKYAHEIQFLENDESISIAIDKTERTFSCKYNIFTIVVWYFEKNLDSYDNPYFNYYNKQLTEYDIKSSYDNEYLPKITFNTHMKINSNRKIKFLDAFQFSSYTYDAKELERWIYITTLDYIIMFRIFVNSQECKQMYKDIEQEVPEYFKSITENNLTFNSWDDMEKCADDLVDGECKSITLTNWYNLTNDIVNSINVK